MTYSISNGATTVILQAVGNDTYGDPQLQNMKVSKESQTWEMAIPASDSNATIVIDLLGTRKTISLTGTVKGIVTQLDSFINDMSGFLNSNQYILAAGGLTSVAARPASTSIIVIMKSFEFEYDAGTPNAIFWSASLLQGNS